MLRTSTQHPGVGKHLQLNVPADTKRLLLQQAFLNDISPSNLRLSDYFQNEEDLRAALDAVYRHYDSILALYNDLLAESTEDVPQVPSKFLLEFVRRAALLPRSKSTSGSKILEAIEQLRKPLVAAASGASVPGDNDIRQFENVDRATLLKVLLWICKQ